MKSTLHTHTTFCDGASTPHEMAQAARALGCKTLGFSGHAPLFLNGVHEEWTMTPEGEKAYRAEIARLQKEFPDLSILLGIEQDVLCPPPVLPYDYIIGSVHGLPKGGE